MATQKINQINYAGVTYKFVDDECQENVIELEGRVNRLYQASKTSIDEEVARAKAAEQAILSTQVAKEAGKGLSTNDFTNYYKNWIDRPPVFTIATAEEPAHNGVVPGPTADEANMYLQANGMWSTPHDTTYENATATKSGLMSFADKIKLDDMDGEDEESMACVTTIGDGTISQEYGSGKTRTYQFNSDGSINETIVTSYGKTIRLKTTFTDGVITKEVIK